MVQQVPAQLLLLLFQCLGLRMTLISTSCIAVFPSWPRDISQNLKTGDGNSSIRKNLSSMAKRFWLPQYCFSQRDLSQKCHGNTLWLDRGGDGILFKVMKVKNIQFHFFLTCKTKATKIHKKSWSIQYWFLFGTNNVGNAAFASGGAARVIPP